MENRITLWLENNERNRIEARIKQEYPKIKNVSELVRVALNEFLTKNNQSTQFEADSIK
jgi:Arc/MetJ-type ribon-helix-helix transcriptional regulator